MTRPPKGELNTVIRGHMTKAGYDSDLSEYYLNDDNFILSDADNWIVLAKDAIYIIEKVSLTIKEIHPMNEGELWELYKHNDDYIIYGEEQIICLDSQFQKRWAFSSADILLRQDNKRSLELSESEIVITDWQGYRNSLDYDGNILSRIRVFQDWN